MNKINDLIFAENATMLVLIIEVSGIIALGGKKTVKLIIALVGNVSNNSIGWISTICIMNQLKFYKRIEKIIKILNLLIIPAYIFKKRLHTGQNTRANNLRFLHPKRNPIPPPNFLATHNFFSIAKVFQQLPNSSSITVSNKIEENVALQNP